jgi:hypothetical protein
MPRQPHLPNLQSNPNLRANLVTEGAQIHARYGPAVCWDKLQEIIADRSIVRYPCELVFDATLLLPGEFAHTFPKGISPGEGFSIHLHPSYAAEPASVPCLVMSQLPYVNYGAQVSVEDAETFGGCALGMTKEAYYEALCSLAEQLGGDELC